MSYFLSILGVKNMYDNLKIYYKKEESNNMIYSIDKIRLKTYISYSEFSEVEFLINSSYKDKIKRFWISDRVMCFHYNYALEFEEYGCYIAFMHNNEGVNYNRNDLKYNFTIEFNPNKAKQHEFVMHILNKFGNWLLRSFDVAIDIPINILDLIFDIGKRRKVQTISYGGDNVTYNFGKNDGRVKIYNKKRENDLPIVGDLTRVEISREFDDFSLAKTKLFTFDKSFFPTLYLNQYIFTFSDLSRDKTTMALLYAVQSGYPIKSLSRSYKNKIQKLLEGGSAVKFNNKSVESVFQQLIYSYFVRRDSKQLFL